MSYGPQVWVLLDVDVEFDGMLHRPVSYGRANPMLENGIPEVLELLRREDVVATFYLQEQGDAMGSVTEKYPRLVEAIVDAGHEVGVHVHLSRSGYSERHSEISVAVGRLREKGYRPNAFRAGWCFTNTATLRVLEDVGIGIDASPWKGSMGGPMRWYQIPDSPYHPSSTDISRVGASSVLVVPMSNKRLGLNIDAGVSLAVMRKGVEALLTASGGLRAPLLVHFAVHSWSLSRRPHSEGRLGGFLSFLRGLEGVRFLGIGEAGRLWEDSGCAPYYLDTPDLLGSELPLLSLERHYRLSRSVLSWLKKAAYRVTGVVD